MQATRQLWNEERYSKRGIDAKIRAAIAGNPDMQDKIAQGVTMVQDYMNQSYSYASKNSRVVQLQGMDINELVNELIVGISYFQEEELLTSATSQLAGRLKWDDKAAAITTVAELLAVLCMTDAFDICKGSKSASLMVVSRVPFAEELVNFIRGCQYLPPMVCEPLELTSNRSSGYLTHNDSLILKAWNHHDGDICLDALNIVNSVAMRLDTEFIGSVEENPNTEFTIQRAIDAAAEKGLFLTEHEALLIVQDQIKHWKRFKAQSYEFYLLMCQQGNQLWLTNKVDKRGRTYAQGYHMNPQGTSQKKAMLEFAKEELIEGI